MVTIMDITLKRILSLIPKKEDGKFKHGALSTFARKLGFKDGHIISDWIAGNSTSFVSPLFFISNPGQEFETKIKFNAIKFQNGCLLLYKSRHRLKHIRQLLRLLLGGVELFL